MKILIPLLVFLVSIHVAISSLPSNSAKNISNNADKEISLIKPLSARISHIPRPNKVVAKAFLDAHNVERAKYGSRPLRWDKKLARFARRWSFKMHSICNLTHSHGPYGENLFIGKGKWTIQQAMHEWAKEVDVYNWMSNTCAPNEMCGHFTQMIWEETKTVGCGTARCNETHVFMTCNYEPGGNYVGRRPVKNYQKYMH